MIPVIWWKKARGNWDHGMLMDVFNRNQDVFQQFNQDANPSSLDRAIVIVTGNPYVADLVEYLNMLKSGLVIYTSDEEARWEIPNLPHIKVWTQYWKPGMNVDHRILMGYPSRLPEFRINRALPKEYLFSYVGQVQNEFRLKCVNRLKELNAEKQIGFVQTVEFFGGIGDGAMDYQSYLDLICKSKYVICPSGSFSVESFRLYEALECGAIPIVDMRSPKHPLFSGEDKFNWWREVCPEHNLMLIDDWGKLDSSWFQDQFYTERLKYNDWWEKYKVQFEKKLIEYAANKD